MLLWKDEVGTLSNYAVVAEWRYRGADWVVEPGFPNHHLRIIRQFYDVKGVRWYQIFDTSLTERYSDYKWRCADELESKSRLEARPHPDDVPAILQRPDFSRYIPYSILARTDCESLQRWIHTGAEDDRWSPQVWKAVAGAVISGSIALACSQPKRRQTRR